MLSIYRTIIPTDRSGYRARILATSSNGPSRQRLDKPVLATSGAGPKGDTFLGGKQVDTSLLHFLQPL